MPSFYIEKVVKVVFKADTMYIVRYNIDVEKRHLTCYREKKKTYYGSPRAYEATTGKIFSDKGPSIHRTGSVRGMVKLGFWPKDADKVRHGNWIYLQK